MNTYERPQILSGRTMKYETPFGNAYIITNVDEGRPVEIAVQIGKAGYDLNSNMELIGRLSSLCLQHFVPIQKVLAALKGTMSQFPFFGDGKQLKSIPDAMGYELEKFLTGDMVEVAKDYGEQEKTDL